MPWFYAVAERDHEIQNPLRPEKILELGRRLRLGPATQVLDLACGKCGPAAILAGEFGCRITAVERAPEFVAEARERISAAGLEDRIELVLADAAEFDLGEERYDVVMCLGASFIWGGLEPELATLRPAVRSGGAVVVGEPFWNRWPLPEGIEDGGYVSLAETASRFAGAGLPVETLISSSVDDWDRYQSLHWRALEEWLADHPDDEDAPRIRELHERYRDEYVTWERELLGWAVFVGRKRA
jgi:SAM-dependent methyltransferase